MDPVTIGAASAAIAVGAGGALGSQLWAGFSALVRRPLRRAHADAGFRDALQTWWEQASQLRISGDVANTISGGTFHKPVLQYCDFPGLTFDFPASPAPDQSAKCRARSLPAPIDIDRSLPSDIRLSNGSAFPLTSSRTTCKRNSCCSSARSEGFEHEDRRWRDERSHDP